VELVVSWTLIELGNEYSIFCRDDKEYYHLGKEIEWVLSRQTTFCLQDFLMDHRSHNMGYSGDQWNLDLEFWDDDNHQPREGWTQWDDKASIEDFRERNKPRETTP